MQQCVDIWGLKAERPFVKNIPQLRCKALEYDVLIFISNKHMPGMVTRCMSEDD